MDPQRLLFAIRDTTHALMARATSIVQAQGLSMTHMFALRLIDGHPGIRPGDLAQRLTMTPGSLTPILQRLVDENLIRREADPDDRRAQQLHVAAAGLALRGEIEAHMGGLVQQAFEGWAPEEIETFAAGLARLQERLDA